jgi:hypothetical protein
MPVMMLAPGGTPSYMTFTGQHADLQKRRTRIEQHFDPMPRQNLVTRQVFFPRFQRATSKRLLATDSAGSQSRPHRLGD